MKNIRTQRLAWFAAAVLTAASLTGCASRSGPTGTFDSSFNVNGSVRIELANGSGNTHVTIGPVGEVRVHGEFHVHSWPWQSDQRRLQEVAANPPVLQEGNLIRIGSSGPGATNITVDYTIVTPEDTQIRTATGSGDIEVSGIQGPANFTSGSGNITATDISSDVQVVAGSGDIQLSQVKGRVQATAGSGDVKLTAVRDEIRAQTGSGTIHIEEPGDTVVSSSGSGNLILAGITGDLRVHTGSGNITVDGNPGSSTYWDFRASSGNIALHVPQAASFRFYAHSNSGNIESAIPIVMEGTSGKHELRARIGDGKARVEVETTSGNISLQ